MPSLIHRTTDPYAWFADVLQALRDDRGGTHALDAVLAQGPEQQGAALRDPVPIRAHGITPLAQAVWTRNVAAVQRLLGLDPSQALDTNEDGHTPLMIAIRQKDPTMAGLLLPVSDLLASDPMFHETVLEQVVLHAPLSVVDRCLPYLASSVPNADGRTLLMLAAAQGGAATVRALVPVSAVEAQDAQGRTALMLAVQHGQPENLRALLPWIDPLVRDRNGKDAIDHLSLRYRQRDYTMTAADWACVDLLALGTPEAMGQLLQSAPPRQLPLWGDPVRAQQERQAIQNERTALLRTMLEDAMQNEPPATTPRARARL